IAFCIRVHISPASNHLHLRLLNSRPIFIHNNSKHYHSTTLISGTKAAVFVPHSSRDREPQVFWARAVELMTVLRILVKIADVSPVSFQRPRFLYSNLLHIYVIGEFLEWPCRSQEPKCC